MTFSESCHPTKRMLPSSSFPSTPTTQTFSADTQTHWFATIPPERRGIDGTYDYFGLRNRVVKTFEHQFGSIHLSDINLTQRGAVIVLQGQCCDLHLIYQLIAISLRTEGTEGVEINGVTVF